MEGKNMKLLIITQAVDENNPVLGFFLNWIKEFAKHCESVVVLCLYKGKYELPNNVKVISLGKENNYELRITNYDFFKKIKYIINFYKFAWRERKNYDAVFVHMNQIYVVLGGWLWKILGKKIGLWYVHKKVSCSLYFAEKLVDDVFTASKKSFRLASKKIKIVGHGIDTKKFIPVARKLADNTLRIITVGRISPAKDYETLIEAVDLILKNNSTGKIKVSIIGEPGTPEQGVYLEKLKKMVIEKKVEKIIEFLGAIANKDIISFLQNADLLVNTSHTGSLDKAVLEAMSCQLLIVTTNEAFVEILGDLSSSLVVGENNPPVLAKRIEYFMSTDNQAEKLEVERKLREIVVNNHALNNLIIKILKSYGSPTSQ